MIPFCLQAYLAAHKEVSVTHSEVPKQRIDCTLRAHHTASLNSVMALAEWHEDFLHFIFIHFAY
jgi:hypothetical protein